jgi:hypothetical protein
MPLPKPPNAYMSCHTFVYDVPLLTFSPDSSPSKQPLSPFKQAKPIPMCSPKKELPTLTATKRTAPITVTASPKKTKVNSPPPHCTIRSIINRFAKVLHNIDRSLAATAMWHQQNKVQLIVKEHQELLGELHREISTCTVSMQEVLEIASSQFSEITELKNT